MTCYIVENIKNRKLTKVKINCSTGSRQIDNSLTNQISTYDKIKNEYNNVQKTFAYIIILNLTLGSFFLFSYKVIGSHTKYQKLEI